MTIHLGSAPASSTLYIPFNTFDSTGASVTISNFALGDILIYKNGSTTQRSSTAGFTLLDTDGVDFDSVTGVHGFSVDLSDNTDAGFYAAGAFYWVIVSTITANAATVSFVAATFRIVAAEAVAGYPAVDTTKWLGGTIPAVNVTGVPKVDVVDWLGGTIPAVNVTGVPLVDSKYLLGTVFATPATAGIPSVDAVTVGGVAAASTADIATGIWQDATANDFTAASSIGKALYIANIAPGAAGGHFIAGTNAATTVNFTGSLSGSVGSVTATVNADIKKVNAVTVNGAGTAGSPWGP